MKVEPRLQVLRRLFVARRIGRTPRAACLVILVTRTFSRGSLSPAKLIHVLLSIDMFRVETVMSPAEQSNVLDSRWCDWIDVIVFELPARFAPVPISADPSAPVAVSL